MSLGIMGSSAGAGASPVVGTYSGTGSNKTLSFDAPVKAFIVNGKFSGSVSSSYAGTGVWINGTGYKYGGYSTNYGAFQESAFSPTVSGNTITVPDFIVSSQTYNYIAFF